ncbi:hypothetical protein GNY06_12250 [Elizabethkingia argentiflava]|uniref:EamA domain-containing protein n=1 Tax=Elizabethkingia argenteiflava TaxID=2681556 RepID=A0A845PV56_9FLAO|nr:hypothetical protein [Elizabethkingia argenteiflava]NAW52109.1 hypothetical protein [Elizabethkingia argenteiflava]
MQKYIIILMLGALSYAMLSYFTTIAYLQGYTAREITFAQAAIGAISLWILFLFKKNCLQKDLFKNQAKTSFGRNLNGHGCLRLVPLCSIYSRLSSHCFTDANDMDEYDW